MSTLECKKSEFLSGTDRDSVDREIAKILCSQDKACEDGEFKLHCSKRSMVGPSKEDPKLFLGVVWCPCHTELPPKD